jgi:hypothetical protein
MVRDWKRLDANQRAICIVIAVLFNPFAAIFLSKIVWMPIDLACGWWMLKKYPSKENL